MADQLGLPFSHQRYVHVVINGIRNSTRGVPIYTDSQQPDSAYMRSWFAEDDSGEIFKIDDWFEFDDTVTKEFNVDASLRPYVSGGAKKKAAYRWMWEKKFNRTLTDDYSSLFGLVDAVNAPTTTYVEHLDRTIDVDEWLTVFALRHAVGDWDGYGYNRGKNQFTYKPTRGKWKMLLWDLDFSLGCSGGHGPTQNLFETNGEPPINKLYAHPHFRRLYFQALHRIASGPFDTNNVVPILTAKYNAFRANGVVTTSPFVNSGAQNIPIPTWINQRRNYILTQLRTMTNAPFSITSNGGSNYTTNTNSITLTGTAAIEVKTIKINGSAYPIRWTSPTNWSVQVALTAATNNLTVEGFHYNGSQIATAQDTITIEYTGTVDPAPVTPVFINEWMAGNTTLADSADGDFDDWFELYNAGTAAVDLSGFTLTDDLSAPNKWPIPAGTMIPAGGYLLVWADEEAAQNAIGSDLHANFKLGLGGEALGLYTANGKLVDSITFNQQTNDVSQGRWPNGNADLYFMSSPTPRSGNSLNQTGTLTISRLALSPQAFEATWQSQIGTRYRVLYKSNLTTANWQPLTEITATGSSSTFTDPRVTSGARFYRLETVP
jgi:hypothetical protein